jgi:hypothetical protein
MVANSRRALSVRVWSVPRAFGTNAQNTCDDDSAANSNRHILPCTLFLGLTELAYYPYYVHLGTRTV